MTTPGVSPVRTLDCRSVLILTVAPHPPKPDRFSGGCARWPDEPVWCTGISPAASRGWPPRSRANYQGYVPTHGYDGYERPCPQPGIRHFRSWAHVRRLFEQAVDAPGKVSSRAGAALQHKRAAPLLGPRQRARLPAKRAAAADPLSETPAAYAAQQRLRAGRPAVRGGT